MNLVLRLVVIGQIGIAAIDSSGRWISNWVPTPHGPSDLDAQAFPLPAEVDAGVSKSKILNQL